MQCITTVGGQQMLVLVVVAAVLLVFSTQQCDSFIFARLPKINLQPLIHMRPLAVGSRYKASTFVNQPRIIMGSPCPQSNSETSRSRGRKMVMPLFSMIRHLEESNSLGFDKGKYSKRLLTKEEENQLAQQFKLFKLVVKQFNYMNRQFNSTLEPTTQEVAKVLDVTIEQLETIVNNGKMARNVLVEANIRLVYYLARKYRYRGLTYRTLVLEGCRGLVRAVEKFEPDKNVKLATYSVIWIKNAFTHSLALYSRMATVPVATHHTLVKVHAIRQELKDMSVENLSIEELAELVGKTPKSLRKALAYEVPIENMDDVITSPNMKQSARDGATRTKAETTDFGESEARKKKEEKTHREWSFFHMMKRVLTKEEFLVLKRKFSSNNDPYSPKANRNIHFREEEEDAKTEKEASSEIQVQRVEKDNDDDIDNDVISELSDFNIYYEQGEVGRHDDDQYSDNEEEDEEDDDDDDDEDEEEEISNVSAKGKNRKRERKPRRSLTPSVAQIGRELGFPSSKVLQLIDSGMDKLRDAARLEAQYEADMLGSSGVPYEYDNHDVYHGSRSHIRDNVRINGAENSPAAISMLENDISSYGLDDEALMKLKCNNEEKKRKRKEKQQQRYQQKKHERAIIAAAASDGSGDGNGDIIGVERIMSGNRNQQSAQVTLQAHVAATTTSEVDYSTSAVSKKHIDDDDDDKQKKEERPAEAVLTLPLMTTQRTLTMVPS